MKERRFIAAVPRLMFCEEIKAPSAGDAAYRVRDSGAFDKGMEDLAGATEFEDLIDGTVLYVFDVEKDQTICFDLKLGWKRVGV